LERYNKAQRAPASADRYSPDAWRLAVGG